MVKKTTPIKETLLGSYYSQELPKVVEYTREPSPYDQGVCSYKLIDEFITLMTFNVLLSHHRIIVSWQQTLNQSQLLVTVGVPAWKQLFFFFFFSFFHMNQPSSSSPIHLLLLEPKELKLH